MIELLSIARVGHTFFRLGPISRARSDSGCCYTMRIQPAIFDTLRQPHSRTILHWDGDEALTSRKLVAYVFLLYSFKIVKKTSSDLKCPFGHFTIFATEDTKAASVSVKVSQIC